MQKPGRTRLAVGSRRDPSLRAEAAWPAAPCPLGSWSVPELPQGPPCCPRPLSSQTSASGPPAPARPWKIRRGLGPPFHWVKSPPHPGTVLLTEEAGRGRAGPEHPRDARRPELRARGRQPGSEFQLCAGWLCTALPHDLSFPSAKSEPGLAVLAFPVPLGARGIPQPWERIWH